MKACVKNKNNFKQLQFVNSRSQFLLVLAYYLRFDLYSEMIIILYLQTHCRSFFLWMEFNSHQKKFLAVIQSSLLKMLRSSTDYNSNYSKLPMFNNLKYLGNYDEVCLKSIEVLKME